MNAFRQSVERLLKESDRLFVEGWDSNRYFSYHLRGWIVTIRIVEDYSCLFVWAVYPIQLRKSKWLRMMGVFAAINERITLGRFGLDEGAPTFAHEIPLDITTIPEGNIERRLEVLLRRCNDTMLFYLPSIHAVRAEFPLGIN